MTDTNKPLPCPFCPNGEASIGSLTYSDKHEAWWADGTRVSKAYFVYCIICGSDNRGLIGHQTPEIATNHWNTRTPGKEVMELVEACIDIVMEAKTPTGMLGTHVAIEKSRSTDRLSEIIPRLPEKYKRS